MREDQINPDQNLHALPKEAPHERIRHSQRC
jgi:hypothetical protein